MRSNLIKIQSDRGLESPEIAIFVVYFEKKETGAPNFADFENKFIWESWKYFSWTSRGGLMIKWLVFFYSLKRGKIRISEGTLWSMMFSTRLSCQRFKRRKILCPFLLIMKPLKITNKISYFENFHTKWKKVFKALNSVFRRPLGWK